MYGPSGAAIKAIACGVGPFVKANNKVIIRGSKASRTTALLPLLVCPNFIA